MGPRGVLGREMMEKDPRQNQHDLVMKMLGEHCVRSELGLVRQARGLAHCGYAMREEARMGEPSQRDPNTVGSTGQ